MKKRELKKKIEKGFSELAPDIFDLVLEETEGQALAQTEERPLWTGRPKEFDEKKAPKGRLRRYALSACIGFAALCLCFFGLIREQQDAIAIVLDINPSIEVKVNEDYQVKRLSGLNEDGKKVVEDLEWEKNEPLQDVLDVLIQDTVKKSYLCENGGILVSLFTADKGTYKDLEHEVETRIDQKLVELKVPSVTVAFQHIEGSSAREGRKLLEKKLVEGYGLEKKRAGQMTVPELIKYCKEKTSMDLDVSEPHNKEQRPQKEKEPQPTKGTAEQESGAPPETPTHSSVTDADSDKETGIEKAPEETQSTKNPASKEPQKETIPEQVNEEGLSKNSDKEKDNKEKGENQTDKEKVKNDSLSKGKDNLSDQKNNNHKDDSANKAIKDC